MALLLYFTYSFLKTLAIHFQGIFVKKIFFYFKFRRFRLRFFLQNLGVLKLLLKVFQSASKLEMCCWIAFKLHKNILHHICYSITTIFSENCNFFNSHLTHFSTGGDVEFLTILRRYRRW